MRMRRSDLDPMGSRSHTFSGVIGLVFKPGGLAPLDADFGEW
jgi:hypothetical protein